MRGRIIIASGGTGGHMFPAIALGQVLEGRGHRVAYAVDARGARYLPADAERFLVHAASPSGGTWHRLKAMALLGSGLLRDLVRFLGGRPQAVAAFGGYASVPTGLAAGLLRVPLVLHEQNAVFGRAHRLLLRFADAVALTFEATTGFDDSTTRAAVVGNPVRAGFAPAPAPAGDRLRLFVVGGSQGATAFADVVPAAIGALSPELRARIEVVQQCRGEDVTRVAAAYDELGVVAEVAAFFNDMPERLATAHLVVSRAGASAVAEFLVMGRAAVLVPYPAAADDHQRANARALEARGAAVMLDHAAFTPRALASELERLMTAPEALAAMGRAAQDMARPDAAERLADLVLEVAR